MFLKTHVYGYIEWPLINLILFHFWKMPCFGYLPPGEHEPPVPQQSEPVLHFMSKVPMALRGEVLALEAEQHYLRVHTSAGNALILYRFSQAVSQMGEKGMQVHRSYWVAFGAVIKVAGSGTSPRLVLCNAMEVPVSRSFRQLVQQAGFLQSKQKLLPSGAF